MSTYVFSPSKKAFYPSALKATYQNTNSWPSDVVNVTDAQFVEFSAPPPAGKQRGVVDGKPAWIDAPVVKPTDDEIQTQMVAAVQKYMDTKAAEFGYTNIMTAVTYAEEPAVPKFQAEGQAFRAWRSLVWAKCYEIVAAVKSGTHAVPTAESLIAELPAFVAPTNE